MSKLSKVDKAKTERYTEPVTIMQYARMIMTVVFAIVLVALLILTLSQ